jgi:hypothetical protein
MSMTILYQKKIKSSIKHIYNTISIDNWNPDQEKNYCFYYNWCDQVYGIEFKDCLNASHINFLQNNPKVKIIYDFNGEPILESIVTEIVELAELWRLNSNQLIVTVNNVLQKEFVEKIFKSDKVKVLIQNYEVTVFKVEEARPVEHHKKFSVMCRIHRPWRSYMICRLKEKNLLENFHYSFIGCENDIEDVIKKALEEDLDVTTILTTGSWKIMNDPNRIIRDLTSVCKYNPDSNVIKFIKECPHYIEKENFKTDAETPQEVFASDIHIVIENGFFDLEEAAYTTRSVEMGEKTFKAIVASKPFLIYSDQHYLKNIRYLGFKTFSPLINEDYDDQSDPKVRAEMIIKEIERINLLNPEEYTNLLKNCRPIAEHNFNLYSRIKEQTPNFTDINFYDL